jgi:hypothetical protein
MVVKGAVSFFAFSKRALYGVASDNFQAGPTVEKEN